MATRRAKGVEESIVQTLLLIPVAVAAVITVVQYSLALAFGLGAIVAAVRFRNALKDTADALYIFVAIAVGLAVGVQAIIAGGIMSVVFNVTSVALWRCGYGRCSEPNVERSPGVPAQGHVVPEPGGKTGWITGTNQGRNGGSVNGEQHDKMKKWRKRGIGGVLAIQAWSAESAQRTVEAVLEKTTKRWQIDDIKVRNGKTLIRYVVRLDRDTPAESVVGAVIDQGSPNVLSATFS